MTVAILMPAYNEGQRLQRTLRALAPVVESCGPMVLYLVDDGSRSPLDAASLPTAPDFSIVLARHRINLGQGAAIETARVLALASSEHDVFVTMDSDGQHRPTDLPRLVEAVRGGADVAFGNRFATASNVPFTRRLLLQAARLFEAVITGLWLSDAHNGYRAFSRKGAEVVRIRQNRMAHATEIKQAVGAHKRELRIVEIQVTIDYSEETLVKGQSSLGAVHILRDLAFRFLFGSE